MGRNEDIAEAMIDTHPHIRLIIKKEAYQEVFDIFDKYACIKDDKWYIEMKNKLLSKHYIDDMLKKEHQNGLIDGEDKK